MPTLTSSPLMVTGRAPPRVCRVKASEVTSPSVAQSQGEEPGPVAAHLRDAPVGVPVVHEPVGAVLGGNRTQDAIGSEPAAPIAQRAHLSLGEPEATLGVEQHHEVVLGPVPLEE